MLQHWSTFIGSPYLQRDPCDHTVIDGLMPRELLRAAEAEWPDPDWPEWHLYDTEHARKYATRHRSSITPAADLMLSQMALLPVSQWFCSAHVFPDMQLHGAGMHMLTSGGRLGLHRDAEAHPVRDWKRELSAVLFVGDWDPEWGGQLQLGDKAIDVRRNRLVIFRCAGTVHGVPEPVRCPEGASRKSLALFWWSSGGGDRSATSATFL